MGHHPFSLGNYSEVLTNGVFPSGLDSRSARQVDRGGGNRINFQSRHSHSSSSSATRRSTAAIFAPCLSSG